MVNNSSSPPEFDPEYHHCYFLERLLFPPATAQMETGHQPDTRGRVRGRVRGGVKARVKARVEARVAIPT